MLNKFREIVKNVINFIYDNSSHHFNKKEKHNKSSPKILKRNIKRLIPVGMLSAICALSVMSISAVTVGVWNEVGYDVNGSYWENNIIV